MQWWMGSLLLLVLTPMVIFADDADQVGEGWPVEQRCALVVNPPDDWQFEGTVIARGWAGLHGMNAQLETPYILAFNSDWLQYFADGSLSPDGRWYAVPHGTSYMYISYVDKVYISSMQVTSLAVYDLVNGSYYTLPWDYLYEARTNLGPTIFGYFYAYKAPVWMDERTIFYASGRAVGGWSSPRFFHVIDAENRTVETLEDTLYGGRIDPTHILSVFSAPDWSRFVIRHMGSITLASLRDDGDLVYVYEALSYNYDNLEFAWHPASTEWIVSGDEGVFIVDRDGNQIDMISAQTDDFYLFYSKSAYSADGEWLYFWTRKPFRTYNYLLANRADRVLVDTCLEFSSAIFSPDGRYMAGLMDVDKAQPELHIFDIDRWKVYPTGIYHKGYLMGWGDW